MASFGRSFGQALVANAGRGAAIAERAIATERAAQAEEQRIAAQQSRDQANTFNTFLGNAFREEDPQNKKAMFRYLGTLAQSPEQKAQVQSTLKFYEGLNQETQSMLADRLAAGNVEDPEGTAGFMMQTVEPQNLMTAVNDMIEQQMEIQDQQTFEAMFGGGQAPEMVATRAPATAAAPRAPSGASTRPAPSPTVTRRPAGASGPTQAPAPAQGRSETLRSQIDALDAQITRMAEQEAGIRSGAGRAVAALRDTTRGNQAMSAMRQQAEGMSARRQVLERQQDALRQELRRVEDREERAAERAAEMTPSEAAVILGQEQVQPGSQDEADVVAARLRLSTGAQTAEGVQAIQQSAKARQEGKEAAKLQTQARNDIQAATQTLEEASAMLQFVNETGGRPIGLPGSIAQTGAAAISNVLRLFNVPGAEGAAQAWSEFFASATPGEISEFKDRAQRFVASQLSLVTGEESGRFTEAERLLTERILNLNRNLSTPEEARRSLATAAVMSISAAERARERAGMPRTDLSDPETAADFYENLRRNVGLTAEESGRVIRQLREFGEIRSLFGQSAPSQ